MQTSAAGSRLAGKRRTGGFTLLELLVVVSIIAVSAAGISLSMRDGAQTRLEREAGRLSALLESARARSQTTGVPVIWRVVPGGFRFEGLPAGTLPEKWLNEDTVVPGRAMLELGPEPVIARQSVRLSSAGAPSVQWQLSTDGLRAFQMQAVDTGGRP